MSYQQLRDWLLTFVSEVLEVTPAEIDVDATWEAVGVDSATVLVLVADLTASTGLEARPAEVLDHPSVHALAAYLAAADRAVADRAVADQPRADRAAVDQSAAARAVADLAVTDLAATDLAAADRAGVR